MSREYDGTNLTEFVDRHDRELSIICQETYVSSEDMMEPRTAEDA